MPTDITVLINNVRSMYCNRTRVPINRFSRGNIQRVELTRNRGGNDKKIR